MSAPSSRARLFGLVAAVLGLVVSAGLAEVALRVADYPPSNFSPWIRSDRYGFRLAPGIATRMRGPEYDVEVRTNSLGLRDDEPGPKAGRRVLLLGDSFAMGYGVPRGQIFADLLEKQLGIDVVDAGTGGYEIVQQPRMLADLAPRLQPDLVVYALYLGNDLAQNDEWEITPDGVLRNRQRQYPVQQAREVKLVRLVQDFLYGVRQGRSEKEGEWLPFDGYLALCARDLGEDARRDYADADRLLGDVQAEAKRLGIPLLVVEIPYRSMVEPEARASLARKVPGLEEHYDLGRPAREIGARMDARGIAHADATPFLVQQHATTGEGLFFPIDGHLTPAGHAALARFLAPLVAERLAAKPHL